MSENKRPGRILWLLLFAYAAAVTIFYVLCGQQLYVKTVAGDTPVTPSGAVGEITAGTEIRQGFTLNADRVELVRLTAATYGRENDCSLTVAVNRADGGVLTAETVPTAEWTDNSDVTVYFSFPAQITPGEPLYLSVTSDGVPGSAVTLYYGTDISVTKGSVSKEISEGDRLTVNGALVDGVLCFQLSGSKDLLFGRIYWAFFGSIGILLAALIVYELRQQKAGKATRVLRLLDALYRYRFLLRQLVERDFKTKYKRSALGMLWSFLNPLLMMLIYYVVFSTLFHSDIQNFPVYLIIGIVCFNFFGEATNMALQSIVGNAALITKVYVPKYIYPASRVASSTVNLLLSLIPLLGVMLITGIRFRLQFVLVFFGFGCLILLAMGVGMLLASAMVFFRDTQFLWGICLTMLNFLTPVFYPESIIPARFVTIFKLNPLYHILRFNRIVLMDGISPEPKAYLFCLIATLVPLVLGLVVFKKTQDRFVLYL